MDFISVYCELNSRNEVSEIAALRVRGGRLVSKNSVVAAFTTKVEGKLSNVIPNLRSALLSDPEKYFVVTYILEQQKQPELATLFENRAWVDTYQLAWPLVVSGLVGGRNLTVLANHFGVKVGSNPDSAEFCTVVAQIYGHMIRRYHTALAGEAVVRDIGGDTLENIRKMVGF